MDLRQMDEDRDAALVFYGMQPLIYDGTRRTVSLAGWLHDMESIFRICHIEARLQVLLASRCLAGDARLWWLTLGEQAIPRGLWAYFRALIITRYGPLPDEEANMPYRDPKIYNDMYMRRYLSYVIDWHAYPNESMGHYCQRFQDSMLPYIPQDIGSPELQALHLLKEGLPPEVRQFIPAPMIGVTLENMIDVIMEAEIIAYMLQAAVPEDDYLLMPVDDAGIREPLFQGVHNITNRVAVSIPSFTSRRAKPHRLVSKIVNRLLTYSIDISISLVPLLNISVRTVTRSHGVVGAASPIQLKP
ncbi:hypothetical protein TIFTF001_029100 [Ficus carica]|uniref:Retrotransposon gag domain-containing protein n=1 Tax=Ficus carica TaxID=3494 RepID=A0AA88DQY3_FICCA|nr:hypothetical protein TIFTF001_029100 [Ficus carica]